ncbi:hypothetical protein HY947_03855 [Candidatus Gottesmanbacteria bacterium]|nr:hypothetical protein [Candidatus Gottesmanbacteria bacterium]
MNCIAKSIFTGALIVTLIAPLAPVFAVSYQAPVAVSSPTEKIAEKVAPSATGEVMMKKPEYPLPFPGILPDHPLYFIKRFRDQMMERLIVDPVSKAKFYILMGDKHVEMAVLLEEKGNTVLAGTMAAKAEMYLGLAYEKLVSLKGSEKEFPGYMVEHLINAATKHGEVLTGLSDKTKDPGITSALGAAKNVLAQANSLK